MLRIPVEIELVSPLHLSSGQADVNVDAEVIHDACGVPYFPAKRFKGLLYESALEVVEMSALSGFALLEQSEVDALFQHGQQSEEQIIVPDFYLKDYAGAKQDWEYLQARYPEFIQPEDVLEQYTSIRYQTEIDPNTGTAKEHSLHNMRVVESGLKFVGEIRILQGKQRHQEILALALQNLTNAGMKRNRGFGRLVCKMQGQEKLIKQLLGKGGSKS